MGGRKKQRAKKKRNTKRRAPSFCCPNRNLLDARPNNNQSLFISRQFDSQKKPPSSPKLHRIQLSSQKTSKIVWPSLIWFPYLFCSKTTSCKGWNTSHKVKAPVNLKAPCVIETNLTTLLNVIQILHQ
ncbi:hypothetical protein ES288_D07G189600v1 [Gossypium darwinii]|uniref:Uncharacterized protein n=1 Tax=Gossypium darwinii TaxID=34276 RepID=A0A5D2C0Z4_GOSDA|nr:hypothetical protein ES288_D07G189600v1 [Gossypium darwinii]